MLKGSFPFCSLANELYAFLILILILIQPIGYRPLILPSYFVKALIYNKNITFDADKETKLFFKHHLKENTSMKVQELKPTLIFVFFFWVQKYT